MCAHLRNHTESLPEGQSVEMTIRTRRNLDMEYYDIIDDQGLNNLVSDIRVNNIIYELLNITGTEDTNSIPVKIATNYSLIDPHPQFCKRKFITGFNNDLLRELGFDPDNFSLDTFMIDKSMKGMKRLKRILVPHTEYSSIGHRYIDGGQEYIEILRRNGNRNCVHGLDKFSLVFKESDDRIDGRIIISTRFAKELGIRRISGAGGHITIQTSEGQIKGSILVKESMIPDIVIHNVSDELKLDSTLVYINYYQAIDYKPAQLDFQSLCSFYLDNNKRALSRIWQLMEDYMKELLDSINVNTLSEAIESVESWNQDYQDIQCLGMNPFSHPFTIRNIFNQITSKAEELLSFHIPLPGVRVYASLDPNCIDKNGAIIAENTVLKRGQVGISAAHLSASQSVLLYRSPNHPGEGLIVECIPIEGLDESAIIFHPADIEKYILILGGGDQDDMINVITDKVLVDAASKRITKDKASGSHTNIKFNSYEPARSLPVHEYLHHLIDVPEDLPYVDIGQFTSTLFIARVLKCLYNLDIKHMSDGGNEHNLTRELLSFPSELIIDGSNSLKYSEELVKLLNLFRDTLKEQLIERSQDNTIKSIFIPKCVAEGVTHNDRDFLAPRMRKWKGDKFATNPLDKIINRIKEFLKLLNSQIALFLYQVTDIDPSLFRGLSQSPFLIYGRDGKACWHSSIDDIEDMKWTIFGDALNEWKKGHNRKISPEEKMWSRWEFIGKDDDGNLLWDPKELSSNDDFFNRVVKSHHQFQEMLAEKKGYDFYIDGYNLMYRFFHDFTDIEPPKTSDGYYRLPSDGFMSIALRVLKAQLEYDGYDPESFNLRNFVNTNKPKKTGGRTMYGKFKTKRGYFTDKVKDAPVPEGLVVHNIKDELLVAIQNKKPDSQKRPHRIIHNNTDINVYWLFSHDSWLRYRRNYFKQQVAYDSIAFVLNGEVMVLRSKLIPNTPYQIMLKFYHSVKKEETKKLIEVIAKKNGWTKKSDGVVSGA